jgi:hypothetical protein
MAGNKPANKTEQGKGHKAYWQQPWVQCVMKGEYSLGDKLLFMRALSFAPGYCSMSNETLMDELGCCKHTLSKAITSLWRGGELLVTGWGGNRRRLWAIKAPGVREALQEWQKTLTDSGKVTDMASFLRKVKFRQIVPA